VDRSKQCTELEKDDLAFAAKGVFEIRPAHFIAEVPDILKHDRSERGYVKRWLSKGEGTKHETCLFGVSRHEFGDRERSAVNRSWSYKASRNQ
jgi:hypothetical protein